VTKYFCIIDFEAQCGSDGWNKINRMEIIEFASIFTDKNFKILGEFNEFVQPILFPELTEYCKNLTTIKQEDIDKASTFDKVLIRFKNYMNIINPNKDNFLFCSWGNYDLRQLKSDCELHNIQYPFNDNHCNLKDVVSKKLKIGKSKMGMDKVLEHLNLKLDGIHHRGIDDCRNILKICRKSQISIKEML
jgi:inhibitor of KinA sporulation pathway (predicted exonuclease)